MGGREGQDEMVHKLIRGRLSMPGRIRTEAMRIEREVADRLL